jgi:hypothetical protein
MQNPTRSRNQKWILAFLSAFLLLGAAAAVTIQSDAGSVGPDVTIIYLNGTRNYGSASGIRAYAVGTTSCNVGDTPLLWCDNEIPGSCENNEHPVIAQNLYRLANGRFEQIGASWLKHGFLSLNTPDPACGNCQNPPLGGSELGVGCTDAYGSNLNGSRPLGMRSEVNPATGVYPFPFTTVGSPSLIDQRIQVLDIEVDPTLNPGARYFIEGQYVAPDDAAAGNGLNNASYQEVTVNPSSFNLQFIGGSGTVREKAAIEAWPALDSEVDFLALDVPSTPIERFHVARRVSNLGGGIYHYEYAIHNLNSDRSARSLQVRFPGPVTFSNVGFRDIDHHSGEPYDTTDWAINADNGTGTVTWSTDTFASDPNANALRWGTMFNFWFDANAPDLDIQNTLGLFRAGSPDSLPFNLVSSFIFSDAFESETTDAWSVTVP